MYKLLLAALATCFVTGCTAHRSSLEIARNGKPAAEIVVDKDAHAAVQYAGTELQYWLRKISGATIPIVSAPTGTAAPIRLAVNPQCSCFADDLNAIGDTDGYAVRPCPNNNGIVILGTRPKGVLNGIYKVLFKNTDIIWARPDENLGTLFTQEPNLFFADTDYRDIPVYVLRGWQMSSKDDANARWLARNAMNWGSATNTYSKETEKYDPIREFGGGHNLTSKYISEKKYYKQHPEFFPLVNGQRVRPSQNRLRCQLCFTNKDMTNAFIQEIDQHFKECPNYDTYRIMIEDNHVLCNCDECLKPITLADGSLITKDDPAFRSTQFFRWLNPIARHIKDTYHKRVLTFAYFFTETPPKCAVEDNISISLCPIGKNSKYTVLDYENIPSKTKLDGWLRITPNVTWREYYGLCWAFPRPMDAVATVDWRYANANGVSRTYSELYGDTLSEQKNESWDINAMYFWVMTQNTWNPYMDVKTLRHTFLTRVFGPAAPDVESFYAIIEDSWNELPGSSNYRDKCSSNWMAYVVRTGKTDSCRKALDNAAAKKLPPKAAQLLSRIRTVFDRYTQDVTFQTIESTHTQAPPSFNPLFNSGAWTTAQMSDNFLSAKHQPVTPTTEIRMLHDEKAFYIGARCNSLDFDKLQYSPPGLKRDQWPTGEKLELFLTGLDTRGKLTFYQFVITPNGNIFDSCGTDNNWNGNFSYDIDKRNDGWSLMLTIPYETIGFKEIPQNVKTGFIRYATQPDNQNKVAYWNDIAPHSIATFIDVVMK